MSERNKINWLLILQGWAMLWVVIGHSPLGELSTGPKWVDVLYKFAYSFHMPLFMMVSGWLFYLTRLIPNESSVNGRKREWPYNQIVKDKALRLLLPGLVFSILSFAIKLAFPSEMSRKTGLSLNEVVHAYLYPYDNPMRELWFIVTLFWLMLLAPLWQVVLRKKCIMWGSFAILLALHFWHPSTNLLCFQRVFSYAIWFYWGIIICKTNIVERGLNKMPWATLLAGIAIYVIGLFTHDFITTIGGITLSIGFALLADRCMPKLFFTFRDYTYQIFLMGIFAQMAVKIAYRHMSMPYSLAFFLCILSGLYLPVLMAKIVERINWMPLSLCYGLKKK